MKSKIRGVAYIELPTVFEDERGSLQEIFRLDWIPWLNHELPSSLQHNNFPAMAYVSFTNPGVMRGPHEHFSQNDALVFMQGSFHLTLEDNRFFEKTFHLVEEHQFGKDCPMLVIVPHGVKHSYKNIGGVPAMTINLPDKLYRGWDSGLPVADEIRHEDVVEN